MSSSNYYLVCPGAWNGGSVDEPGSDGPPRGHDRGSSVLRAEAGGSGQSGYVVSQGKFMLYH